MRVSVGATALAVNAHATALAATERTLHIVARVGAERFAFPVAGVEEALDAPAVAWVPVAPDGMTGQLLHRDRMIPAWDAGWAFRLATPATGGAALVLRDGTRRVAFVVDDVLEMARIEADDIRAVPGGADLDGVLSGICFATDGGNTLLNIVRVDALVARLSSRGTIVDGEAK